MGNLWTRYKLFLITGLIIKTLLFMVVFVLYFTDLFVLKEIRVLNNKKISADEVKRLTDLKGQERLFRINLKDLEKRLKAHPLIEEVVIIRRLPSLLEIIIKEREALAILIKEHKGYLIDRKGIIIGGVLPQDYLYYPLIEIKNETWKDNFLTFLEWLKTNKKYLPVYENYSKITLDKNKIIFQTKNHIKIYFPLGVTEELTKLYLHLDRIMVYLYESKQIEKIDLIRMDYPFGQALIKFRS
ncbi:MAG: FtsQ-type POTRA domain-containing protein [Caldimicrobium sp.]|nr:FtsQ-type POTRA domain-containing protein [Caldimicrobium sp.]MCX7873499.1 FtsQ-type POTRA domain-containing protein [Caldimicrobium sp.]MDW8093825.1 FtsQ-type POTRA domain-containing protein [Caldimicrobium sp.]